MVRHTLLLLPLLLLSSVVSAAGPPDDRWGVTCWASWRPDEVNRRTCPEVVGAPIILSWNRVEPADGDFRFAELLDEKLRLIEENDYGTFLMLWVGPAAPRWIYEKGVPEVRCTPTMNPKRQLRTATYPFYLHPKHKEYFHRLIGEFGRYVLDLPVSLRRRIMFIQIAEGSTGDGWGYKGEPLDEHYNITRDEWGDYRIETWDVYKRAFSRDGRLQMRFLVNDDSSMGPQHEWLMENLDVIGCKQGMFSHGYHISDTIDRLAGWRRFVDEAERAGKQVFVRGEQDAEWQVCGWSRQNPLEGLYWSALFATHCGIDLWNVPSDACQGDRYARALRFFNKYAGRRDPTTAPSAFCALRQGLNAADAEAFPEDRFGEANKRNIDRYLEIAEAFADRGARQGDPEKATGGGMENRQRDDYNDVGWNILPGNYERFLSQIDPEQASVGLWHVGPKSQPYGRFARRFDHAHGRTVMRFRLDEHFFSSNEPVSVRLGVVYLDRGRGSWQLVCASGTGRTVAAVVKCRDSGEWKETTASLENAVFARRLEDESDLALEYVDGDDTVFHMIELDR